MCRLCNCAGCTLYARCAYRLCKALPRLLRSMDGGGGAREAAAAALETEQRLRDLGYGQGPIAAVENDQIGGGTRPPAPMGGGPHSRPAGRGQVATPLG